jgi:hypothetical protein
MDSEILLFASVFGVAAGAGLTRVIHNGQFVSVGNCIGVAGMAGFLGFTVVAVCPAIVAGCGGAIPKQIDEPMLYLGISAGVGILGREVFLIIKSIVDSTHRLVPEFVRKFLERLFGGKNGKDQP